MDTALDKPGASPLRSALPEQPIIPAEARGRERGDENDSGETWRAAADLAHSGTHVQAGRVNATICRVASALSGVSMAPW
jgi:hypothetical protein